MTQTTSVQERYTRFSYPKPQCTQFNGRGEGNIAHRSWTGKHQHIERLRCTACGREFSKREDIPDMHMEKCMSIVRN